MAGANARQISSQNIAKSRQNEVRPRAPTCFLGFISAREVEIAG